MIKVLSIRQPWAWLIASGHKDIENRSWPTHFRGDFYVHAGKYVPYQDECQEIERTYEVKLPEDFDVGGIIGKVTLVDCVAKHQSKWFLGPYGFVLSNAQLISFVPVKGRLGFFQIEKDFEQQT
jgi:hypothetical protein